MDDYQSNATFLGDVAVSELHAHFAGQLESADWRLTHQGGDERAAWSTWQLPGQDWHGFLLVLNAAGSRRASVLLRVEAADRDRPDGSSVSVLTSSH
jgi:hypothetical protein